MKYTYLGIIFIMVMINGCTNTRAIITDKDAQIEMKDQQIAQLRSDLSICNAELDETKRQCSQKLSLKDMEDREIIRRERELRKRLASDIEAKNIEIKKLHGFLTVKVMEKVLFRSGSTKILPEGEAILSRIATSLSDSSENLNIEGHTDDVLIGPSLAARIPTNWELSVLRAAQVVRFLENNNIAPERLSAVGHSKHKPLVENSSNENRQLNRRVEIVLVPKVAIP